MKGLFLVIAIGLAACSYRPSGAGRTADPPEQIARVGLIELTPDGEWIGATGLYRPDADHPFTGPVTSGVDGHRARLVGFTEAQLEACTTIAGQELEDARLWPASSRFVRYPEPAWSAAGVWEDGLVDFDEVVPELALTSDWIAAGVDACRAHVTQITSHTQTSTHVPEFVLRVSEGLPLLFTRQGTIFELDPEAVTTTLVQTSSVPYIGGFVDDDDLLWLFRKDGRFDTWRVGEEPVAIGAGGFWAGNKEVWVDGGPVPNEGLELFVLSSQATFARYANGTWTELFQGAPRPNLPLVRHGDVLWDGPREAHMVMESRLSVFRYRNGRVDEVEVSEANFGAPLTLLRTERYGFVASTAEGAIFRQVEDEQWGLLRISDEGRPSPYLFDFGTGLLLGGAAGMFSYYVEGIERCTEERLSPTEIHAAEQIGNRVLVFPDFENRTPMVIVAADVTATSMGCGRFEDIE